MEKVGIFYGHLEYVKAILVDFWALWFILWPFGKLEAFWYIFPCLGISWEEKSGNPGSRVYDVGRCPNCVASAIFNLKITTVFFTLGHE
jgi:TRAP-type mannitol/chloroaromatic compound transport system permease small subunit